MAFLGGRSISQFLLSTSKCCRWCVPLVIGFQTCQLLAGRFDAPSYFLATRHLPSKQASKQAKQSKAKQSKAKQSKASKKSKQKHDHNETRKHANKPTGQEQ